MTTSGKIEDKVIALLSMVMAIQVLRPFKHGHALRECRLMSRIKLRKLPALEHDRNANECNSHEQANLEADIQELHVAEQALKAANYDIEANRKSIATLEKQIKSLIPTIQTFETKKAELEDELARLDSTKASSLPSLESELKKASDELTGYQDALKEAGKAKAKLGREAKAIIDERKKVEANIAIINKKISDAEDAIKDARKVREGILLEKNTHDSDNELNKKHKSTNGWNKLQRALMCS